MSRFLFASTLVLALAAPLAGKAQGARLPGGHSTATAGGVVRVLGGGVNGGSAQAPEISLSGAASGLILLAGTTLVSLGRKRTA